MPEIIIIIIAIVFSVWSELNKKKKEEDFDIDFAELSSIDDFLKKPSANASSVPPALPPLNSSGSFNRSSPKKQGRKKQKSQQKKQKNYDKMPSLTGQVNYDQQAGRPDVNYDKSAPPLFDASSQDRWASQTRRPKRRNDFRLDRNQIVKSFIFSEVLRRYDINRIYDRIPGVRNDD